MAQSIRLHADNRSVSRKWFHKRWYKWKFRKSHTLLRISYTNASTAFFLSLVRSTILSWSSRWSSWAWASDSSALVMPPYTVSVTGISSLLDDRCILLPSACTWRQSPMSSPINSLPWCKILVQHGNAHMPSVVTLHDSYWSMQRLRGK